MSTPPTDLFIDGQWRAGSAGERFDVHNPADGTVLAQVATATEQDCLAAVEAAHAAGPSWAATPPRERAEILRRCFEILTAERDGLAECIKAENGKAWADAVAEATYATEFFRWFSEEAVRIGGDYRLSPAGDKRIIVTHEPIGVSVLITPWNFPAAMATRKIAPALAAGCTAVLKPATETPLSAAFVIDALQRAGVPAGVVNLITPVPAGPAIAAVLKHPAVRKLSFTGSTEVGRVLLRQAAEQVLSCSMELGGNAPFLVLPGADVQAAADGAVVAKMRNGGAACTAANRFYVHRSLAEEFGAALTERFAAMTVGPGRDADVGALVSAKERDKVHDLVRSAVDEGALVRLGGEPGEAAFYPPTVLTGVEHGGTITSTEVFGPVAPLIVFDEIDDAIRMANDTVHGLIAYVYGPQEHALHTAHALQSGMVGINRGMLSDPAAPFGGMKQSGLGREGAGEGIEEFLEEKYIAIDR